MEISVFSDVAMTPDEMLAEFKTVNYMNGWQSDWNGYEVGYPLIDVVGFYASENGYFYIDMSNSNVRPLQYFSDSLDDEEEGEEFCVTLVMEN